MKIYNWVLMAGWLVVSACGDDHGVRQAALDGNKVLVQRYFNEVWNQGKTDLLDSLLDKDYINHTPSDTSVGKGREGLRQIIRAIRRGIPDIHYEIQDMVVTGDRAAVRLVVTGTQTDSLFGLPSTGRQIRVNQINIEEIVNGKISEHWRVTDELEMMKQLGFVK